MLPSTSRKRIGWIFFYVALAGFMMGLTRANAQDAPLFAAIKANDRSGVQSMLDKGADPNAVDKDGDYPLMYAALYSSTECMRELLDKGAKADTKNATRETALFWAIHDTGMTRLLLDRGADVNARAASGNTPLLIACIGGRQDEIINILLQYGADMRTKNNMDDTPLMYAAAFGDTPTIRLLLNKGIDINTVNKAGMTALSFAIKHENVPAVLSLLENGANANLPDGTGSIPFSYAAILDPVIAVAVLNKTTDVNTVDGDGNTLLMWTVFNEHDSPNLIRLLLKRGALVNKKAKDGSTALSWALKKGNTETVEILKNAGAK